MTTVLRHILLRVVSVFLMYTLLLPFAMKLDHVFENHTHSVCDSKIESHFHTDEFDCDFLNYKTNQIGYLNFTSSQDILLKEYVVKNFVIQNTFYQNEKVTSLLRGPPSLS